MLLTNNKRKRGQMARIRLNNEYRNKIANRMRVHLEQEDTQEKRKYDKLKGEQIDLNDNAWKIAEKIVRRHYTEDDVEKAYYLQNKFENVSTIAKDSCFHFHYLGQAEEKDYDQNVCVAIFLCVDFISKQSKRISTISIRRIITFFINGRSQPLDEMFFDCSRNNFEIIIVISFFFSTLIMKMETTVFCNS